MPNPGFPADGSLRSSSNSWRRCSRSWASCWKPAERTQTCDVAGGYQTSGGMFLLARDDGRLVGTVALPDCRRECSISPLLRPSRVARAGDRHQPHRAVLAHALRGRWRCVCLDTTGKSPTAARLFRRHGFVEIERLQRQSPSGDFHGIEARFVARTPGWRRGRRQRGSPFRPLVADRPKSYNLRFTPVAARRAFFVGRALYSLPLTTRRRQPPGGKPACLQKDR